MNKEFKDVFEFLEFHSEHFKTELESNEEWTYGENLDARITDTLLNQGNCLDELADMVVKIREELALGGLDMFEFNNK